MKSAIQLLKQDHKTVKALLKELGETSTRSFKARPRLLQQIEHEISIHSTLEEEILYPAILKAAETNEQREMLAAAFEEHRVVESMVLPDLKLSEVDSVKFGGRAKVLRELVEHHVDEEEAELFPLAEKLLSEKVLEDMLDQMEARKSELLLTLRPAA